MSTLELASVPTFSQIVADLLDIMRRHTKATGEGWNGATTIEQAGIDSLELAELLFDIEDKYRVETHFSAKTSHHAIATVDDVARLVQSAIRQQRTAK